jgi:GDPmannose 4,6-dehydratase
MTRRTVLVTGATGQDGWYLCGQLVAAGADVVAAARADGAAAAELRALGARVMTGFDLSEPARFGAAVRELRPAEVYHLAACHFSADDERNETLELAAFRRVHVDATDAALSAIRRHSPGTRFFFASSCHVFGEPPHAPQTEATPRAPAAGYGITKQAGAELCLDAAERGTHAVVGILYNHESPRRAAPFVTALIARAAADAAAGRGAPLALRDLDAVVDWGAAEDYVRAMALALQARDPGEYIIASGTARTVRDFAAAAYARAGLDAAAWVTQAGPAPPSRRIPYIGDSSRLNRATGWEPQIGFESLAGSMVEAYLK